MSTTASRHPSERALADFIAGELPAVETRQIVRHLLQGCAECQWTTSRYWPPTAADHPHAEPELNLRIERLRAREQQVTEERKRAILLLEELEGHPRNRRMMLVINSRRFHNWFLAELILTKIADLVFKDPAKALDYSQLAVALSDRLSAGRYGEALVNDMRGRSWGAHGNALRLNSELVEAREAFRKAEEALEAGTGDPLEEARLASWKASYFNLRRDVKRATRLYDRAIRLYRRAGDEHLMGRAMADKGTALCTDGDFEGAIRATEESLRHIDAELDPRSMLAAKHNLSLYLHRYGDIDRAMNLLQEILPLYARQSEPMVLLRLRWLEGRLAQTQREFRRAEEAFREVQRGFIERGIPYDAAAVSFDLATILVEENRFEELADLASQILAVFRSLAIPRETIAAIELFQQAIGAQRIGVSWIAELAAYIERSQVKPGLPFKPTN